MAATDLKLYLIAKTIRALLEKKWISDQRNQDWYGSYSLYAPSRGKCGLSASLLYRILRDHHHPKWDYISSNYIDREGCYQGHAWNSNPELGLILDITADQFNDMPIVIATLPDRRYHPAEPSNHFVTDHIYLPLWEAFSRRHPYWFETHIK
jgi:hypothetical protein